MGAFYRQISNLYMLTIPGTVFLPKKSACGMLGGLNRAFDHLYMLKIPGTAFLPEKETPAACSEASTVFVYINKVPVFGAICPYSPLFATICRYLPLFAAIRR